MAAPTVRHDAGGVWQNGAVWAILGLHVCMARLYDAPLDRSHDSGQKGDRPVCALRGLPACLLAGWLPQLARRPGPVTLVGGCAAAGPFWALGILG